MLNCPIVSKLCRLGGLAMLNCPIVSKLCRLGGLAMPNCHLVPKMCRLGGLAMVNCSLVSKDVRVRWIGHAKLPLSVMEIDRVTMWGYGDRAWVGLLSVQAC